MIGEVSQLANDFWILLAMVIYFAAMLSIGFIYSKRSNSSSKEYFAGGRGVGPWLTALSAEALRHERLAADGPAGPGLLHRRGRPDVDRHRPGASAPISTGSLWPGDCAATR